MSTPIYTGVGSRKTPVPMMDLMTRIAQRMEAAGYILRTGDADGADYAFKRGASPGKRQVLNMHHATPDAHRVAAQYHPAWDSLRSTVKALHARNAQQVLGYYLDKPSRCVICWTPDGKASGGTGQAIRIAIGHGIPVYNLHDPATLAGICANLGITP